MVHGKVLRSETPHARIVSIDTAAAEAMPGVVAVLIGADLTGFNPLWGHAIKDRAILATDRVRFHGEPVAAVAAVDEATAEAAVREIFVEYEELPVVETVTAAVAEGAPLIHEEKLRAGPLPRARRDPRRGRQRLLPVPPRRRLGRARRGRSRADRGRGVRVPRRLPVRDGDPHGDRRLRRGRDHPLGLLPAPVPGPRRDRRPVQAADRPGAGDRALPRRRLRLQELHEDGAADRGAVVEGGPAGADPEPRRRVDGHHPAPRDAGPDADHGDSRRAAGLAQRPPLARHRRLRRQRPAGLRDGRRRRPRPLPLGRGQRRRQLRLHQHLAGRLLPRLRRRPHAVDGRAADRRAGAQGGDRPAGDAPPQPAAAGRTGPPRRHRQAARRRPDRRRREGGGGGRLGRAGRGLGRPRRLRRAARRRRPPGLAGERADGGRRQRRGQRRHHRNGPGRAHRDGADRQPGARHRPRPGHRPGRRHPLHPVRPLDRRQPLDDARRARRAARGGRPARPPGRDRGLALGGRARTRCRRATAPSAGPARRPPTRS